MSLQLILEIETRERLSGRVLHNEGLRCAPRSTRARQRARPVRTCTRYHVRNIIRPWASTSAGQKMKFILASLSIGAMCLSGPMCLSANAQQPAPVLGFGSTTCGTWVLERRDRSTNPVYARRAWITGYLAGVQAITGSPTLLVGIDDATVDGWVDNYCAQHQFASIGDATEALIKELRPRIKNSN